MSRYNFHLVFSNTQWLGYTAEEFVREFPFLFGPSVERIERVMGKQDSFTCLQLDENGYIMNELVITK